MPKLVTSRVVWHAAEADYSVEEGSGTAPLAFLLDSQA
jgi:hypothetical protein